MSLASATTEEVLPWVKAELNYLAPTTARPRTYTYVPPEGIPPSTAALDPHTMVVSDLRSLLGQVSLDREGFDLVRHASAVTDFLDAEEVKRVYYPEVERLLKEVTGADRVLVFDNTVRRRVPGVQDRDSGAPRQPVPRVHVDHTERSGPQRVRDLLPGEADELLRGRVQVINVWRPIRGPLKDTPLAVCDASTVKPEQLAASARPTA
jgi:hypothetical protein